jgi:hypothetical protein
MENSILASLLLVLIWVFLRGVVYGGVTVRLILGLQGDVDEICGVEVHV